MAFKKGDTYNLSITIIISGTVLGIDGVDSVEFMFDSIRKVYSDASLDGVTFDTDHFIVPLTQEETFSLQGRIVNYQVRVKFDTGQVKGSAIKTTNLFDSLSKEVL